MNTLNEYHISIIRQVYLGMELPVHEEKKRRRHPNREARELTEPLAEKEKDNTHEKNEIQNGKNNVSIRICK